MITTAHGTPVRVVGYESSVRTVDLVAIGRDWRGLAHIDELTPTDEVLQAIDDLKAGRSKENDFATLGDRPSALQLREQLKACQQLFGSARLFATGEWGANPEASCPAMVGTEIEITAVGRRYLTTQVTKPSGRVCSIWLDPEKATESTVYVVRT